MHNKQNPPSNYGGFFRRHLARTSLSDRISGLKPDVISIVTAKSTWNGTIEGVGAPRFQHCHIQIAPDRWTHRLQPCCVLSALVPAVVDMITKKPTAPHLDNATISTIVKPFVEKIPFSLVRMESGLGSSSVAMAFGAR
ncbi:cationic peroxidase 1-like [Pyrus ussuriensis x Pyrus communis]|uniref:Cationic peroxidase 1-like n=1 Tax=Pyrus ussuriensis x Pyrus communis TaxID=2448454 RepID=A0A5N5FLE6_9ROSA|nr:cationic peroxidase 1-like [Pyrus ussuriensis x Pyrus communis]